MNSYIPIEDKEYIKTSIIKSIEIKISNIKLFSSVSVIVFLKEENGGLLDVKVITLEGQDYINWGNDDNYIIDYVLRTLDMTKLEVNVIDNNNLTIEQNINTENDVSNDVSNL